MDRALHFNHPMALKLVRNKNTVLVKTKIHEPFDTNTEKEELESSLERWSGIWSKLLGDWLTICVVTNVRKDWYYFPPQTTTGFRLRSKKKLREFLDLASSSRSNDPIADAISVVKKA